MRINYLLLAIAFIFIVGNVERLAAQTTAAEFRESAKASLSKQEYDRAAGFLTKAIALDPANQEAFILRGNAYLELKDFGRSIADADQALKVGPEIGAAYYLRGVALSEMPAPDLRRAMADFTKMIDLEDDMEEDKPKDKLRLAEAYRRRAHLHNLQKEYDAAIADATQAIINNNTTTNAFEERGFAEAALQKFAAAERDYRIASLLNPRNASNFAMLSYLNLNLGQIELGIENARAALKLDPNNATAKTNLDILLAKQPKTSTPTDVGSNDEKVQRHILFAVNYLSLAVKKVNQYDTDKDISRCPYVRKAKEFLATANAELDQAESLRTVNDYSRHIREQRSKAISVRDMLSQWSGC